MVASVTTEGVPEITPVSESTLNPVGREGVMDTLYSAPAITGSIGVIARLVTTTYSETSNTILGIEGEQ